LKKETAQRHTLKFTAFFFAISLWYYVLNSEAVEIEKKLPVNFILPKGMLLITPLESEIAVKLKGSKAFLQNIFLNKDKINIDLSAYYHPEAHLSEKSFKVKIYASDINVPFGVNVLEINPKEINIELDQKGLKEVPIQIQYIGVLSNKRILKDLHATPEKIMVSGPISILRHVNSLEIAPFNLALLNKDEGSLSVQIGDVDPRIKIEDFTSLRVKFKTQQNVQNNIIKTR
jgi:YbbR domain-containing protein